MFLGCSCQFLLGTMGGGRGGRKRGLERCHPRCCFEKSNAEKPVQLTNVPGEGRGRDRFVGRGLLGGNALFLPKISLFNVCILFPPPLPAATTKVRR